MKRGRKRGWRLGGNRWWAVTACAILLLPAIAAAHPIPPTGNRPLIGMAQIGKAGAVESLVTASASPLPAGSVTGSSGRTHWINWTKIGGSAISARTFVMMANDPPEGGVLAFGGTGANNLGLNDTWLFRNGSWTELCSGATPTRECPTSPPPSGSWGAVGGWGAVMAYDPAEQAVVLLTNCQYCTSTVANLTWIFQNGTWHDVTKSVTPPNAGPLAYDPAFGGMVMLVNGQTWRFANDTWGRYTHFMQLPSPTEAGPLVYDPVEHRVILAGTQTWAFDGSNLSGFNWTQLNLTTNLPAPPGNATYDPITHRILAEGLIYSSNRNSNVTWELNGSGWVNVTRSFGDSPPLVEEFFRSYMLDLDTPLVYDSTASYFVYLDTPAFRSNFSETWLLVDPLSVSLNQSHGLIDLHQSVQYQLSTLGGRYPYHLVILRAPPGCPEGSQGTILQESELTCTPQQSGNYNFSVRVSDAQGDEVNLTLPLEVHTAPEVSVVISPDPTTVNVSVGLSAQMSGGTPPYRELWVWPNGTTETSATFQASWGSAGNYTVEEIATDSLGYAIETNRTVTVNVGVRLHASVSATLADAGEPVWFNASGFGGTAPLSYRWVFGDGTASTGPDQVYEYLRAGTYAPEILVNDTVGAGASETFHLAVNPELVVNLSATPRTATVGVPTELNAALGGGTPPYTEIWTVGSGSIVNTPDASVTFLRAGNWTVSFTVTDSLGVIVERSVVISVSAPNGGSHPTGTGGSVSSGIEWQYAWVGVSLVLAGGVAAGVIWYRRRVRGPR